MSEAVVRAKLDDDVRADRACAGWDTTLGKAPTGLVESLAAHAEQHGQLLVVQGATRQH